MHGAIFLVMKTEGALHTKLRLWSQKCMMLFFLFYFFDYLCNIDLHAFYDTSNARISLALCLASSSFSSITEITEFFLDEPKD